MQGVNGTLGLNGLPLPQESTPGLWLATGPHGPHGHLSKHEQTQASRLSPKPNSSDLHRPEGSTYW